MSSTRAQSRPPAAESSESSADASLAPWKPAQSLPELRNAMTSPGVVQAEVDALFAAIARPPAEDEPPRARADFLHSLTDLPDEAHTRMKGSDGRTVRAAAVEALLELGYPYALEVHPEVLDDVRQQARRRQRDAGEDGPGVPTAGLAVSLVALVGQLVVVAALAMFSGRSGDTWEAAQLLRLALVALPPLAAIFGHMAEWRRPQVLGSIGMGLQGVVWLFHAFSFTQDLGPLWSLLLVVIPWYLPLVAAYLMYPKAEPSEDTGTQSPGEPS